MRATILGVLNMSKQNESEHIYRYPFDGKDEQYNNSYKALFVCSNCEEDAYFRIKHGVKKSGLIIRCDNCKCFQTL